MSKEPVAEIRDAYSTSAGAWAAGPDAYYGRLAAVLVQTAGDRIRGASVLDVGAGTGAVTRAALDAGAARVVAADLSFGMLAHDRGERPPAVVTDVRATPFRAGAFDAATAGCVLNHLPDPAAAVRELGRVVRPGGVVVASTFGDEFTHPMKNAVDDALAQYGHRAPSWHTRVKTDYEPPLATPAGLLQAAAGAGAGQDRARVVDVQVDSGLRTPDDFVRLRLGMASNAPFYASLDPGTQADVYRRALDSLGPEVEPYTPNLLVLVVTV
jgi:SAM-dependent methyltransferase